MNVMFLTLLDFESLQERNIYTGLLMEFIKQAHYVYVISSFDIRKREKEHIVKENNAVILKLKIGNIQLENTQSLERELWLSRTFQ